MSEPLLYASLTRISDLAERPFDVQPLPREQWANADYVVARVHERPRGFKVVELASGRVAEVGQDARIVGALGSRHGTLEAVGTWEAIGDDGRLHFLTAAGLLGGLTSLSSTLPSLLPGRYAGHAMRDGAKLTMDDFVPEPPERTFAVPTVLLIGTSMSAGKTTTGKILVGHLRRAGLRVAAAKLSGAGRYRDILAMGDAGAQVILDFVDVGLPSTLLPADELRPRLRGLLARIAAEEPDVLVAEAGASPLEPYNGEAVLEELGENVAKIVLCASDPYAVVGVMQGFGVQPDLVAGLATSTSAGVELVERLAGVPALNVLDPGAQEALVEFLADLRERRA